MDMSKGTAPPDWSRGRNVMVGDMFLGLYQPSPETTEFWTGVGRRELLFKHCADCGARHHPRRMLCSRCNSGRLGWDACKGRGKVFSFSEVHRAAIEAFAAAAPYTVGVVKLEEGVHLFTRLIPSAPVTIDAPVTVDYRVLEMGQLLPVFVVGSR